MLYINFEFKRPKECENNISSFHNTLCIYNDKNKITGAMHYLIGLFFQYYKKYPNRISITYDMYEIFKIHEMTVIEKPNILRSIKINDVILDVNSIKDSGNDIILSYEEDPHQINEILVNIKDSNYITYIKPQITENNCTNIIKEVLDDASNKYYKLHGYLPDGIYMSEKIYNMLKKAKQIKYDKLHNFGSFHGYYIYMLSRTTSAENIIDLLSFYNKKPKYSNTYKREFKNIHIEFRHNNKLVDYETLYTHPADMLDKQLNNIIESYVKETNNEKPNSIMISEDLYRHFEKRNKITKTSGCVEKLFNKYDIIRGLCSKKNPYTIILSYEAPMSGYSLKYDNIENYKNKETLNYIKSKSNEYTSDNSPKPAQSPKITINDVVNLQPNPDILIPILKSNILNLDLRNIKTLTLAGSYYHPIKWLCENFNLTLNVISFNDTYNFINGKLISATHNHNNTFENVYYTYNENNTLAQIRTESFKKIGNVKQYLFDDFINYHYDINNRLFQITKNNIPSFYLSYENFYNTLITKKTSAQDKLISTTFLDEENNNIMVYDNNIKNYSFFYSNFNKLKMLLISNSKNNDIIRSYKYSYNPNNILSSISCYDIINNSISEINFLSDFGIIHSCSFSDYTTNNQNSFIINSFN